MRIRLGFLLGLLAIFGFLGWLVSMEVPTEKEKTKAKVLQTRLEERLISEFLVEQAVKAGGVTNLANEFILRSLNAKNEHQYSFASRTNALGQVIDIWQTPFQINLAGETHFIVSSAGPNLMFGDTDDIIFNGISNGFVKP